MRRTRALHAQKEGGESLDFVVEELSTKQAELDDYRWEDKVKESMIEKLRASEAEKIAEIDKLKQFLRDARKKAERVTAATEERDDALGERDLAIVQLDLEKQAVENAKGQILEEQATKGKLQEECDRLRESLTVSESKVAYLESEAYRVETKDEYHFGMARRTETTIACKVGYEYLLKQLPDELKDDLTRFRYPPSIAGYIDILTDVERHGAKYDLGEEDAEEDESDDWVEGDTDDEAEGTTEDSVRELGEGSTQEVGESSKEAEEKREVEDDTPSTPPSAINVSLPLTPGADMDLS